MCPFDKTYGCLDSTMCNIMKMIKYGGFPFSVYSLLYDSCVTSVSDYSAAVFGFNDYTSLLRLQTRAARALLGVPKNAPNSGNIEQDFQ